MSSNRIVVPVSRLVLSLALCMSGEIVWAQGTPDAQSPATQAQGPATPAQGPETPPPSPPVVDPVDTLDKRLSVIEEWKAKIERLPSLSNKFNVGLNAL